MKISFLPGDKNYFVCKSWNFFNWFSNLKMILDSLGKSKISQLNELFTSIFNEIGQSSLFLFFLVINHESPDEITQFRITLSFKFSNHDFYRFIVKMTKFIFYDLTRGLHPAQKIVQIIFARDFLYFISITKIFEDNVNS